MKLSIVTTSYYSSAYIDEFFQRISSAARKITADYEIIIVEDGSTDTSLSQLLNLQGQDPRLKIIELSRNFGQHQAGMVGLQHSQGDCVFLLDSDLEEAPELLQDFWDKLYQEQDVSVVYGVQKQRTGNFFQRLAGQFFYCLFNYFSDIKIPQNMMTIRLMKRDYINALLQYPERVLFLGGLLSHVGFKQQALLINKTYKGSSHYSLVKKLILVMNSLASFSFKPIYIIFWLGFVTLLFSTIAIAALIGAGATTLTFANSVLLTLWGTSLLLTALGIMGFYLIVILQEVKRRPLAIIKQIHQQ